MSPVLWGFILTGLKMAWVFCWRQTCTCQPLTNGYCVKHIYWYCCFVTVVGSRASLEQHHGLTAWRSVANTWLKELHLPTHPPSTLRGLWCWSWWPSNNRSTWTEGYKRPKLRLCFGLPGVTVSCTPPWFLREIVSSPGPYRGRTIGAEIWSLETLTVRQSAGC